MRQLSSKIALTGLDGQGDSLTVKCPLADTLDFCLPVFYAFCETVNRREIGL